jgi:hypothetical protein
MSSDAVMTTLLYVFFGTSSCALVACLFPFGWYHEDTIFSMMHGPEGQEMAFGDGTQPEVIQPLTQESAANGWDEVSKHFDDIIEKKGGPWNTIHGEPPEGYN